MKVAMLMFAFAAAGCASPTTPSGFTLAAVTAFACNDWLRQGPDGYYTIAPEAPAECQPVVPAPPSPEPGPGGPLLRVE